MSVPPFNFEEKRARALIDLVESYLPIEAQPIGSKAWEAWGPALIARQAGTLEAILQLGPLNRRADRFVLLRSLYEHAVVFAWLAADPAGRYERFLKEDALQRIRTDNDIHSIAQMRLIDSANRQKFEKQAARLPPKQSRLRAFLQIFVRPSPQKRWMPTWEACASAADKDWKGKLPNLPTKTRDKTKRLQSYRGLYAIAYRQYSAISHPTLMGLNYVTEPQPGGYERIQLEQADEEAEHDPLGLGSVLLALTLLVSTQTLDWPDTNEVLDLFDEYSSGE